MKTKRELVIDTLKHIRIVPVFGTASGEDYVFAADAYDVLHAELTDDGLCYWPNTNHDTAEIPLAVSGALISILGGQLSGVYGKEAKTVMSDDGRPVEMSVDGMRRLRKHIMKRPSGEATEFSSY